jgi:hypothetical protein
VYVEFAIDVAHLLRVPEDQCDKDVHRALLGEPEAERIAAQMNAVQQVCEQNAGTERNQEPDDLDLDQQSQRRLPVTLSVVFVLH